MELGCGFMVGLGTIGLISILLVGLSRGLLSGLVSGLFIGAGLVLINIVQSRVPPNYSRPESFGSNYKATIWRKSLYRLIFAPVLGLICWLMVDPTFGLVCGLGIGLFLGSRIANPFILRFLVFCRGLLPWKQITFLDEAVDLLLMYKTGTGYIFIHRLLLDYFADQEAGAIPRKKGKHEQDKGILSK